MHSTLGLVFVPLALLQFIDLIGGTPGTSLNTFWVFGVTAALAFYAGAIAGVRVQLLLGSIALIVSWSALWNKILSDGIGANYGVYRGLLGILSIGCSPARSTCGVPTPAATRSPRAPRPAGDLGLWKASELFTGAGIAAVLACSLGITAVANLSPLATTDIAPIGTNSFWDISSWWFRSAWSRSDHRSGPGAPCTSARSAWCSSC